MVAAQVTNLVVGARLPTWKRMTGTAYPALFTTAREAAVSTAGEVAGSGTAWGLGKGTPVL